jgi:dUTPase
MQKQPSNPYLCAMSKIKVPVINQSANALPEYATEASAGMDVRPAEAPICLQPGDACSYRFV